MVKTSRDARRHIRELSKLFSMGKRVPCAEMNRALEASKRRKHLKQSFRRLVERGFIEGDGECFSATPKGFLFFRRFHQPAIAAPADMKQWDGKWRLVTFDVPCRSNSRRDMIRSLLTEFDFYQLQKSVWICPTAISKNFWEMLVKEDLDKYCKTMMVDFIESDEKIRQYFRIA